jgi:hypothetical protein
MMFGEVTMYKGIKHFMTARCIIDSTMCARLI